MIPHLSNRFKHAVLSNRRIRTAILIPPAPAVTSSAEQSKLYSVRHGIWNHHTFSSVSAASQSSPLHESQHTKLSDSSSSSALTKTTTSHLLNQYETLVRDGRVTEDQHQLRALTELDRLRTEILQNSKLYTVTSQNSTSDVNTNKKDSTSSSFSSFLSSLWSAGPTTTASDKGFSINSFFPSKGVYLHGGVGCGKTFCMDLFYDSLVLEQKRNGTTVALSKQKVHFHKFMLGVHRQMHEAKMVEGIEGDVLPRVIERTIQDGRIICFDEFQVTDVADALILRRLFTGLLDRGAVIVATSNRPPCDLYLNGLQRDLFLPFIALLEERVNTVSMWDSETDYRLVQGENKARGVYFIGDDSKLGFDKAFLELTKHSTTAPTTVSTQGRLVPIPNASLEYGVARFSFDDLCRKPNGAADFLAIGDHFHTVFIEDVPVLTMNDINLVRRLIVFVDAMYESHVKLIVHAKTRPDGIFLVDLDNEFCDEAFAFDRTRSRLEEMGSDEYLRRRWIGSKDGEKKNVDEPIDHGMTPEINLDDRDFRSKG